jgi:hypothetical protein
VAKQELTTNEDADSSVRSLDANEFFEKLAVIHAPAFLG